MTTTDGQKTLREVDEAEQLLLDNVTGLLNLHTAKNPYHFGTSDIAKVKKHRATMKLVAETLVHRIEREGPSIDALKQLANAKNDLAEYSTAQVYIDQLLDMAIEQKTMTQDSIAFMMTDKCNLRCKHCFIFNEAVFHPVSRKDELASEDYVKIFESLLRTDRNYNIHITGGGEVFARKDFEQIIEDLAALKVPYHVSIQTNGHFPERLRAMLEKPAVRDFIKVMQFSLDGLEDAHNAIRGGGNFEKLIQSIKISAEFGIETSVITTVLPENIHGLRELKAFSESLGVKNHRFQLYFEGAKLAMPDISPSYDFITERDRSLVYNDWTAPGEGCLAGIRTCIIRPNGTIETCRESYSGNVPRMLLADVRQHDFDLPATLSAVETIREMKAISTCKGCAAFCAR
jgi:MoaA/NifB/PqqE/SkfB family radical SAM enzyme